VWGDDADASGFDAAEGEGADGGAFELDHGMAEAAEHAAHEAVAAFPDDELEGGGGARAAEDMCAGGSGASVGEWDAAAEACEGLGGDGAFDGGDVGFGDAVAGVGQEVGEASVVGDDDEAGGILVEPADGKEAVWSLGDEIGDAGGAVFGAGGGDVSAGLVDEVVDELFGLDGPSVAGDLVAVGVEAEAELGDDASVDADAAFEDDLLAVAAASDAGGGEELMESLFHGFGWRDRVGQRPASGSGASRRPWRAPSSSEPRVRSRSV
jgi:hypothetical protein